MRINTFDDFQANVNPAKKNLRKINVLETTIKHTVLGKFGAGRVLLKPASPGTGVIAGGPVRAVIESVGIPNVVTKCIGTKNPHNVVKATMEGLSRLESAKDVAKRRGISVNKLFSIEDKDHGKEAQSNASEESDRKSSEA